MLNYIEYLSEQLGMPTVIGIVLVIIVLVIQVVGEILEFKGKVVPEFIKVRKYFKRKKKEREILAHLPETFKKVETLLNDVNEHYSSDNIAKRDSWMDWVNSRAKVYDAGLVDLEEKVKENNAIALSLLIDNKRDTIIDFASKVVDEKYPATKEQFNRIFKIHEEYEEIIEANELTNGEVDIAIRIIEESYEKHMRNHSFVEDVRGYNSIV